MELIVKVRGGVVCFVNECSSVTTGELDEDQSVEASAKVEIVLLEVKSFKLDPCVEDVLEARSPGDVVFTRVVLTKPIMSSIHWYWSGSGPARNEFSASRRQVEEWYLRSLLRLSMSFLLM